MTTINQWMIFSICYVLIVCHYADGSHFRGGIISWRALNTTPSGSTATILIRQRFSWRRTFWSSMCDTSSIASQTIIGSGTGSLVCNVGSCGSFSTISSDVPCTDFSVDTDFSSGERYDTRTLNIGENYTISFTGSAWYSLVIGGGGTWRMTSKISLVVRPDGYINTSPVTSTLPIIYKQINVQHVHIVQMADADSSDTLKCRWSTSSSNFNGYDECGTVCAPTLPGSPTLFSNNCTLVFSINIADYYAVALQIEDYYTSSSPSPMSSVPIQFLFYGQIYPTGSCTIPPVIIGVRPNLACIGTPTNVFVNETVIAQVGCTGRRIVDFITSSPAGMSKTTIINTSPGIFVINLLWTPSLNQFGPQGFCAGAVDNSSVQSVPWCITFLVGFTAPNLQPPILVQGSASPIGTILANHSIFSIQSMNGVGVNRPGRNGTYIRFIDATANNTVVVLYDCGYSTNVTYSGNTIIIYAPYPWQHGHQYYITFDSGASSGTEFCRAESAPIIDPNFWVFNIWNPMLSSPMTTTTTTQTTSTTSSTSSTTSTSTTATTTTTTTATTTTTTTSTTSTTSTSATTVTTTTQTIPTMVNVNVMSPKDHVETCTQPVAVATAVTMVFMVPVKMFAMFTMFTKINKMFNPAHILANQRAHKH